MKPKKVQFADIAWIQTKEPSLFTGKWRVHGTGNIKTWYPMDIGRHKRDTIFLAILSTQWNSIGFTVENSEKAKNIFKDKGLLV
jgi:hypothetical protein